MDRPLATLGAFAAGLRFDDLPRDVVDHACLVLLDTAAAICAGAVLPEMQALARWQAEQGGGAALQALTLASCGVVHELDEGFAPARGHPAIHTLPAAVAEAAARKASGKDLLTAIVAGYEVAARVGAAVKLRPGMHPHGTWGGLGAAAAVAHLRGCDAQTMTAALELAACMPIATSYQAVRDGSPVRHAWAGLANFTGSLAAALAAAPFPAPVTGAMASLSGILGTEFNTAAALEDLGSRWDILRGYFKVHACCRHGHATLDAIDRALAGTRPGPAEITSVRVRTYADAVTAMTPTIPVTTTLAAKFSMPFMVALRLVRGATNPALFTPGIALDPELAEFAAKVELAEDPELTQRGRGRRGARVAIALADGRILTGEVEHSRGDPALPFGREDIVAKYRRLTAGPLGVTRSARLETLINGLPMLEDCSPVLHLLLPPGSAETNA
jgi:2-methylcitrate dehydratase PrpD